jgi:hypothetical protein
MSESMPLVLNYLLVLSESVNHIGNGLSEQTIPSIIFPEGNIEACIS